MTDSKYYSSFINTLLFIFPLLSLLVKGWMDLILLILFITGIIISIKEKHTPFSIKELKIFNILTVSYFIVVLLSIIFSGKFIELIHYSSRDIYFLLAPFIAFAIFKAKLNLNYIINGAKATLLITGIYIIYQYFYLHIARPSGALNADVFGNLLVILFFIASISIFREKFNHNIITIITLLFGIVAIILSGTRGAWLSFILLSILYLYINRIQLTTKVKLILLSVVVLSSFIISQNSIVKDRIFLAQKEVKEYFTSNDPKPSSVGFRLEMYKTAINNSLVNPIFGYGYRNAFKNIEFDKTKRIGKSLASQRFNHFHNAYLTNYVTMGILGLIAILSILLIPLKYSIKNFNTENTISKIGIYLTISYITFGMVNILFGDVFMNAFYILYIAVIFSELNSNNITKNYI